MGTFEEGEYVVHIVRKHWFIITIRLISLFVISLFPLLLLTGLGIIFSNVTPESLQYIYELFTFLYLVFLLFVWCIGFLLWTDYYLDICIITNKRLMEIEQKGLFNREISALRYEMIQDITTDIDGVIPTLLNYGELYVQTAAAARQFCLTQITNPGMVKSIISEEISKIKDRDLSINK